MSASSRKTLHLICSRQGQAFVLVRGTVLGALGGPFFYRRVYAISQVAILRKTPKDLRHGGIGFGSGPSVGYCGLPTDTLGPSIYSDIKSNVLFLTSCLLKQPVRVQRANSNASCGFPHAACSPE